MSASNLRSSPFGARTGSALSARVSEVEHAAHARDRAALLGLSARVSEAEHAARARAGAALPGPSVSLQDPFARYVASIRLRLEVEDLPVRAPNTDVFVLGEARPAHANAVVRAVAGPVGLGAGARVEVSEIASVELFGRDASVLGPHFGLEDALAWAEQNLILGTRRFIEELRRLLERVEVARDTPLRTATISFSTSPLRQGALLADRILELESKLSRDLGGDRSRIQLAFATRLAESYARNSGSRLRCALRADATEVVRALERRNVLVLACAGNVHRAGAPLEAERRELGSLPGIVIVGACSVQDDGRFAISGASSRGANVLAPGVALPLGEPSGAPARLGVAHTTRLSETSLSTRVRLGGAQATRLSGTSFSTPFLAGVVTLMAAASSRLTASEARALILDPDHGARTEGWPQIPHTVDPVRLVRAARRRR